jgi:hypothetical protein
MTSWPAVHAWLAARPPGTVLRVPRAELPGAGGRFPPDAQCRGLHARPDGVDWLVHLDQVHPNCSLPGHLRKDAPNVLYAGGCALGAVFGLAATQSIVGAAMGAGIGLKLAYLATRPR